MAEIKSTKYYSDKQEKLIADYLDWQQISGSGSRPCNCGDVESDEFLGECKTHVSHHSIQFHGDIWNKIRDEAASKHKRPVYFTDDGSQTLEATYVAWGGNVKFIKPCTITITPEDYIEPGAIRRFRSDSLGDLKIAKIETFKEVLWRGDF